MQPHFFDPHFLRQQQQQQQFADAGNDVHGDENSNNSSINQRRRDDEDDIDDDDDENDADSTNLPLNLVATQFAEWSHPECTQSIATTTCIKSQIEAATTSAAAAAAAAAARTTQTISNIHQNSLLKVVYI